MDVAELGSRWTWWRGALVGVVLAVAAGVLGMHVLTAGHSAHGVGPQAADPASHGQVHEASPGSTSAMPVTATSAAPACDTGCGADMGSVCVAVLVLALLLLRRRDRVMVSWQHGRVGVAQLVRPAGVGPSPPSLVQLCISRT